MGKTLSAFLIGGAIGAAAVYFTSPRSGFENRNLAKDAVSAVLPSGEGSVTEQAGQAVHNVTEKGQEAVKAVAEKGQAFYATATAKVQGIKGGAPASDAAPSENDELRQKIEAARARIAEQVMKNAEDAQLVDSDVAVVEEAEATVVEAAEEPEEVQYTTAQAISEDAELTER